MTQPDLPDWLNTVAVADAPLLLAIALTTVLPITTAVVDVSPFQSVNLAINSASPNVNNFLQVRLRWLDNANLIQQDTITVWGSLTANVVTPATTVIAPCRGNQLQVIIESSDVNVSASFYVFGSRRPVSRTYITADTQSCAPAMAAFTGIAIAAAGVKDFYLGPTQTGYEYIFSSNAAGPVVTTITTAIVVGGVYSEVLIDSFNTAAATVIRPVVYVPGSAIHIHLVNTGGAGVTVQGTVTAVTV